MHLVMNPERAKSPAQGSYKVSQRKRCLVMGSPRAFWIDSGLVAESAGSEVQTPPRSKSRSIGTGHHHDHGTLALTI
jgi:hypothetical protein